LAQIGKLATPSLSEAEAMEQAAQMADRFNRIFLRTLRALRDLTRYTPSLHIENHGQVNIGERQVNVSSDGRSSLE
jgi:hypothetical protein